MKKLTQNQIDELKELASLPREATIITLIEQNGDQYVNEYYDEVVQLADKHSIDLAWMRDVTSGTILLNPEQVFDTGDEELEYTGEIWWTSITADDLLDKFVYQKDNVGFW